MSTPRIVIVLDIEMTQPSRRIFQVGAAALDTSTGEIIDCFMEYFNPEEPISQYIIELCQLGPGDLLQISTGKTCYTALSQLDNWMKSVSRKTGMPISAIGQWGHGDLELLVATSAVPIKIKRRPIDIKTVYAAWCLTQGNKAAKDSLKNAATYLELPTFKNHDALADAVTTAKVLAKLLNTFAIGQHVLNFKNPCRN